MKSVIKKVKDKIIEDLRGPQLVKILMAYADSRGYCLDGEVILPANTPGEYIPTGELIKEIPINPLWAGTAGQGLYALPDPGMIGVIQFINFDTSLPYVIGYWNDGQAPAISSRAGELVVTDGTGGRLILENGLFSIVNNSQSMKKIMNQLIDVIISLKVIGSDSIISTTDPASVTILQTLKAAVNGLFKE